MFGELSPIVVPQHVGFESEPQSESQSDGEMTGGYSDDFESVTDNGLFSSPGRGGALSVASSVPSYQRSPTCGRSLSYSADFEDYVSATDRTGGIHGGCECELPPLPGAANLLYTTRRLMYPRSSLFLFYPAGHIVCVVTPARGHHLHRTDTDDVFEDDRDSATEAAGSEDPATDPSTTATDPSRSTSSGGSSSANPLHVFPRFASELSTPSPPPCPAPAPSPGMLLEDALAALRDIPVGQPALAAIARLNARLQAPSQRRRGGLAAASALVPAPDAHWVSTPIRAGVTAGLVCRQVDRMRHPVRYNVRCQTRVAAAAAAGMETTTETETSMTGSCLGFADAVVRADVVSRLRLRAELECRAQEVSTPQI